METATIISLLDERGYAYELLEHEHVHTSEDAAKVRGTHLEEAAKALVLQAQEKFFMCVVSGHKKLDLKKIKELLGEKNISLAHPDDVFRVTQCKVGTVPPFPGLLNLPGFVDKGVLTNEYVCFSAASHVKSIRMKAHDWLQISGCELAAIAKE